MELEAINEVLTQQNNELSKEVEEQRKSITTLQNTITELELERQTPITASIVNAINLFNYSNDPTPSSQQVLWELTVGCDYDDDYSQAQWYVATRESMPEGEEHYYTFGSVKSVGTAYKIRCTHGSRTQDVIVQYSNDVQQKHFLLAGFSTQSHMFLPQSIDESGQVIGTLIAATTGNYEVQTHDIAYAQQYALPKWNN